MAPEKARIVELRYFAGLSSRGDRARARHCAGDGEAALDVRARLAPSVTHAQSQEPRGPPLSLSREELGELEAIFDDVVHVTPRARAAILADAAPDVPELRAEVEALLDSHEGSVTSDAPDRCRVARARKRRRRLRV